VQGGSEQGLEDFVSEEKRRSELVEDPAHSNLLEIGGSELDDSTTSCRASL